MHVSQVNEHYDKYSKYEFILYTITLSYNFFTSNAQQTVREITKIRVHKILQLNTYLLMYRYCTHNRAMRRMRKFSSFSWNPRNSPSRSGCRPEEEDAMGSIPALPPLSLWEVDGWSPKFHDGMELGADNTLKAPLFCIVRIQQSADNRSIEHPNVQSNIVLAWNMQQL